MKRFFLILSFFFVFLSSSPASAVMLMPSGGWLMTDSLRIRTFTDLHYIYRIAAENITGYLDDGMPISQTITSIDRPFDSSKIALGHYHCKIDEVQDKELVVIANLDHKKVENSWKFDGKNFVEIPANNITCDFDRLQD